LFNRTGGYKGYVFPAVAVIIVQQTLLFGAATFMGGRRRSGAWRMGVAEFCILGCYFLFGFIFWLQAVPVDGDITGMMVMVPVFATAVAALGLLIGSVFDCAERATYILAPTSVPFFFLTGTAYPLDQMPGFVAALSHLIPATAGVHTFVPLNQMHARLSEVTIPALTLASLALGYAMLAYSRLVGFGAMVGTSATEA